MECNSSELKEENTATEILHEFKAKIRNWIIAFIFVLALWIATICVFLQYVNQ